MFNDVTKDPNLSGMVYAAIEQLQDAARRLFTTDTYPATALPRERIFHLAPGIIWPGRSWREVAQDGSRYYSCYDTVHPAEAILRACRYQPRLILRAIRRIEAAARWCEARYQGRLRAAQEILRQQSRAVEALEAIAAMRAMAGKQ